MMAATIGQYFDERNVIRLIQTMLCIDNEQRRDLLRALERD